jgi:hypothetical protein
VKGTAVDGTSVFAPDVDLAGTIPATTSVYGVDDVRY